MNKTRLSVATNFDNNLLERIATYPVEDVYGKLTDDFVGGAGQVILLKVFVPGY